MISVSLTALPKCKTPAPVPTIELTSRVVLPQLCRTTANASL